MKKTHSFLLAASFVLATAFTFSCSSNDSNDGGDSSSSGGGGSSSGGGGGNTVSWQGKEYRTAVIGSQTWFAENLNYAVSGSKCYGEGGQVVTGYDEDDNRITETLSEAEVQANCTKYGRLYDWETAKTVCPDGWHLPTNAEWDILVNHAGGEEIAGSKLKAASGWNENGNGTDEFHFSALPGGYGVSGFERVGNAGWWWSASESEDIGDAYYLRMHCHGDDKDRVVAGNSRRKSILHSVRCVKD